MRQDRRVEINEPEPVHILLQLGSLMQAELSAEHLVASGRVDQPAAAQLVLALLVVLDNDLMPPVLAAQLDSDGPPRVEGDPIAALCDRKSRSKVNRLIRNDGNGGT